MGSELGPVQPQLVLHSLFHFVASLSSFILLSFQFFFFFNLQYCLIIDLLFLRSILLFTQSTKPFILVKDLIKKKEKGMRGIREKREYNGGSSVISQPPKGDRFKRIATNFVTEYLGHKIGLRTYWDLSEPEIPSINHQDIFQKT